MKESEKQVCYVISKSIKESFEESGYLNQNDLKWYIQENIDVETTNKSTDIRNAMVDFIYKSILKNKEYEEFLSGNTLMCSKCNFIKPVTRFNTYKYKGETLRKCICKKCEYDNHKNWIEHNRDKQKGYDKKRYMENRKYYIEKYNIWRKQNEDKHSLYNRQYKARLYINNKLNRELSNDERKLINKLVKQNGMTGLKIYKSGVIK